MPGRPQIRPGRITFSHTNSDPLASDHHRPLIGAPHRDQHWGLGLKPLEIGLGRHPPPAARHQRLRHGTAKRAAGASDDKEIGGKFARAHADRGGEIIRFGHLMAERIGTKRTGIGRARPPDRPAPVNQRGLGLTVLLLLTFVRTDLLQGWQDTLNANAPNHFLINIQPQERDSIADIFANGSDRICNNICRRPSVWTSTYIMYESLENRLPLRRVRHFGVKLHAVILAHGVFHCRKRRVRAFCRNDETIGNLCNAIAMAHPDFQHWLARFSVT